MAKEAATTTVAEGEKKKRKAPVRKPKVLNALLSLDADGQPIVLVASFDALKLLKAVRANPGAALVEIIPE